MSPIMAKRERTKFEQSIPDYRTRLLVALFKALIIPPVLTYSIVRLSHADISIAGTIISTLASIPLFITLRSNYDRWTEERIAARMNSRPIPRIKGKWPGNIDVVIRIVKSFREGYVLQGFADLLTEYNCKTLNTRLFWTNQMITIDESVMKHVAVTNFSQFHKGVVWHERIDKLLGTGLFNTEGEMWKKGRAIARPFFSKERTSDFEVFHRTSSTALALLSDRADSSQPIDIQDLVSRFTLDSASEFLFGTQLSTLSQPLNEPGRVKLGPKGSIPIDGATKFDEFTEAFERVATIITHRGAAGIIWPIKELFHDKTEEPIDIIMAWMDPLVRRAVQRKLEMQKSGVATTIEDSVLMDYLATTTDDIEHIRYELVTYLIASRDTTSSLLTFAIYFLVLHPQKCERLREEIISTLGADTPPTYETLKGMKYLRAFLNETLRLFPSAPIVGRMSKGVPQTIPVNKGEALYFPPNTGVTMLSLLLHRRSDLWGDDADEFRPERWLEDETIARVNATPFMYCPFYGGPRVCIGREFALNEAGFFLVRLLQRFQSFRLAPQFMPPGSLPPVDWKGKPGRQSVERVHPSISFTMFSKGGLWLFTELAT